MPAAHHISTNHLIRKKPHRSVRRPGAENGAV